MECARCHQTMKRDDAYEKVHMDCWKGLQELLQTVKQTLAEIIEATKKEDFMESKILIRPEDIPGERKEVGT